MWGPRWRNPCGQAISDFAKLWSSTLGPTHFAKDRWGNPTLPSPDHTSIIRRYLRNELSLTFHGAGYLGFERTWLGAIIEQALARTGIRQHVADAAKRILSRPMERKILLEEAFESADAPDLPFFEAYDDVDTSELKRQYQPPMPAPARKKAPPPRLPGSSASDPGAMSQDIKFKAPPSPYKWKEPLPENWRAPSSQSDVGVGSAIKSPPPSKAMSDTGSWSKVSEACGGDIDRDEQLHAVVARSTFASQNVQNTPLSDHFWKLRCRKSERRCGAKHISKSKCTKHTRFGPLLEVGSWDVEKVHAVVARSTFRSQNVQNTPWSDHFWKFRCRKSARRCGAKHISKSKC